MLKREAIFKEESASLLELVHSPFKDRKDQVFQLNRHMRFQTGLGKSYLFLGNKYLMKPALLRLD